MNHHQGTFLVGGAVRDKLLGLTPRENDWVVVGSSAEDLLAQGFRQVGRDFPVFLHPQTQEEYALARTERKQGIGYHGFVCHADPSVSLEDDLLRRDLTINAIAEATDGTLIDPFGGQQDLNDRLLRHVSPAFTEDPLRVLRVARFAARFHNLGFRVAPDTLALMQEISRRGELKTLSTERIWQETERALASHHPTVFFNVLRDCHALAELLPTLDQQLASSDLPLQRLRAAASTSDQGDIRFAALTLDLSHEDISAYLRPPARWLALQALANKHHANIHQASALTPDSVLAQLEAIDAWRRPERMDSLLSVCAADAQAISQQPLIDYAPAAFWRKALSCTRIDVSSLQPASRSGPDIAAAIRAARLQRLEELYGSQ
ncbi:MAG: multifunctional CCA tRNA nucleotidyl transferase/2'3'-cyclic phosphodiesterase/2'nucleotidase/phosphatase [Moraxellaceae bacterium]|nr:multifunctional CCA tRNA nucleotidyl transferase/2'3'-cyclic phosphodiesterase/2'nucleotidase/phosphatase [Moraxellaceae bacterium]